MMGKLVLLRHGQSVWNAMNRFTGWVDIPLSSQGIQEALEAGRLMEGCPFDIIFTSTLIRAMMTTQLILQFQKKVGIIQHEKKEGKGFHYKSNQEEIPIYSAWQLNERMYGALQGLNKQEVAQEYGIDQVKLWRRSFDVPPPQGESLQMTQERVLPYFQKQILPPLNEGKNVLISAHGNSLRAIIMELENLSPQEILEREVPTGKPLLYDWQKQKAIPLS